MNLSLRPFLMLLVLVLGFALGMASLLNYFKFESTVRKLQRSRIALITEDTSDAIGRSLSFSAELAASTTLQPLIERQLGADPLILSIDIIDEAGKTLFSTQAARVNQAAPADWLRRANRPNARDWFLAEPDAFVDGLNVANSFGVHVATVVVRYQRSGFDLTVAAMKHYLTRIGSIATLGACLVAGVLLALALLGVRREFSAAAKMFDGSAPESSPRGLLQNDARRFAAQCDAAERDIHQLGESLPAGPAT